LFRRGKDRGRHVRSAERARNGEEVAGAQTRLISWQATALHAQDGAFLHAGWNVNGQRFVAVIFSLAPAFLTWRLDNGSVACAFRACRDFPKANASLALGAHKFSGSPNFAQLLSAARALAPEPWQAWHRTPLDVYRFLAAVQDTFQRDLDVDLDVLPTARTRPMPKNSIKRLAEIKAKPAEYVLEIGAAERVFG
jgi:hypothetical protein